jgi:hypothetical protein
VRVLGPDRVAYLDMSGSGAETVAHVRENGRIVVMFCAFEGPPRIVRLHGTGTVAFPGDARFDELLAACAFDEPTIPEARRAIVDIVVERVAESCGYGVPLMTVEGGREHYDLAKRKKLRTLGSEEMLRVDQERNALSIDGLPAVRAPSDAKAGA